MPKVGPRICCGLFAACALAQGALAQGDRHEWLVTAELNSAAPSTDVPSWLNGSAGKLRFDETDGGIGVSRLAVEYRGRIAPALSVNVIGDYVSDGASGIDLTEAFLEWRPVPKSANRHHLKVGAFYPRLSLENGGPAWTSPFTISTSAINTWVGEEIRTIGAEWALTRSLGSAGGRQQIDFFASAYLGNDPLGTLLAWKGWSLHGRQTRLNDVLPLPPLPQVGPDGMFTQQAVRAEPFIETDDRPGYYYGVEWRLGRRVLLAAMHYDNHADPMSLRNGQYGWTTRFDHIGMQLELPKESGLIMQWIDGTTVMGPILDGARVVDTAFDAWFLLFTKRIGRHRVSLRYDDFAVVDRDFIPLDANDEAGDAWTIAYAFDLSARLDLKVEWLRVETTRSSWAYFDLPTNETERILQARLNLSIGSRR